MPSGILKIAGLPLDTETLDSDVKIEDETLLALLKEPLKPKKAKATKKPADATKA